MLIDYLLIVLNGFFLGLLFIFLLKKLALRQKLLICKGVPLVGGMAIGLSFVLATGFALLVHGGLSREAMGIIFTAFIMLVFGVIDDVWELSIIAKFAVQIIAAALLILFGVRTQIIYIGHTLNIIITLLWVLGITNAFNHLDVMDGLAGSAAAIIALAFSILTILNADIKIIIPALTLTGAICSFLLFNFPPAKIYMGNSGSHLIGFVLAAIALNISYASMERKIALLAPILILGLPIFDTAFLIFMRMLQERSPVKKSNDHLALRFLKKGHSKNKTLIFMLGFGLVCASCGIVLTRVSNFAGLIIVVSVALLSLSVAKNMGKVVIDV